MVVYDKNENQKIKVIYNVEYKFKSINNENNQELKTVFNEKLLNIILKLENQELRLNNLWN